MQVILNNSFVKVVLYLLCRERVSSDDSLPFAAALMTATGVGALPIRRKICLRCAPLLDGIYLRQVCNVRDRGCPPRPQTSRTPGAKLENSPPVTAIVGGGQVRFGPAPTDR